MAADPETTSGNPQNKAEIETVQSHGTTCVKTGSRTHWAIWADGSVDIMIGADLGEDTRVGLGNVDQAIAILEALREKREEAGNPTGKLYYRSFFVY